MLKYRPMIDLQLTDDHEALVQTVREFAQKEVAPYIKEWDEKQVFHREVFDKMAELNLLGVCIPEEFGGAGFDYVSLGLVCEELEACDTSLRVIMSVHVGLDRPLTGNAFTDASLEVQTWLLSVARGKVFWHRDSPISSDTFQFDMLEPQQFHPA